MMKNRSIKNNKGFTLIETMIAVIIMAFSIAIFMSVVANSLFSAKYAKNEIVANYLLQEAIDYIRNDRDTIVLFSTVPPDQAWNNFYIKYSPCDNSVGCSFDILKKIKEGSSSQAELEQCSDDGCPNFYFDPNATDGAFYTYNENDIDGKTKTSFNRKIIVTKESEDEIRVNVSISWKNGNSTRTRSSSVSLTRWQ